MTEPPIHRVLSAAKLLLLIGVLFAVLVVGAYFLTLAPGSAYTLSRSDSVWANFGTYVGGLLGPAFAFLAFVGVLGTGWLQLQQLQLARTQAQLEEMQRVISTVSVLIDSVLSQPAGPTTQLPSAPGNERTVFLVLSAGGTAALNSLSFRPDRTLLSSTSTVIAAAKESLAFQANSLIVELHQLVWCLEEYLRIGGSPTVVAFYKNRYVAAVCWLDALGLANSSTRVQDFFDPKSHRQFMAPPP